MSAFLEPEPALELGGQSRQQRPGGPTVCPVSCLFFPRRDEQWAGKRNSHRWELHLPESGNFHLGLSFGQVTCSSCFRGSPLLEKLLRMLH